MCKSAKTSLLEYLNFAGILTCNENQYLPCISDIGCGMQDVSDLIDSYDLFFCKAYRKRTTYLSREAYFLLKQCLRIKPIPESTRHVYGLLQEPMDMETLKLLSCMDVKPLQRAFGFLLENLYITAVGNRKMLNPHWFAYYYGTAGIWEANVTKPACSSDPREALKEILTRTMSEVEFDRFVR